MQIKEYSNSAKRGNKNEIRYCPFFLEMLDRQYRQCSQKVDLLNILEWKGWKGMGGGEVVYCEISILK